MTSNKCFCFKLNLAYGSLLFYSSFIWGMGLEPSSSSPLSKHFANWANSCHPYILTWPLSPRLSGHFKVRLLLPFSGRSTWELKVLCDWQCGLFSDTKPLEKKDLLFGLTARTSNLLPLLLFCNKNLQTDLKFLISSTVVSRELGRGGDRFLMEKVTGRNWTD